MKKLLLLMLGILSTSLVAQNRNTPKMQALFEKGYYVNLRNDTIKCLVQSNPADETEFHHGFKIKKGNSKRLKAMQPNTVKAYGIADRNYVCKEYKGKKVFLEKLASGRLNFYVYRYHGKVKGVAAIESTYFIRDTWDNDVEKGKELEKISGHFYKKALKPYFVDQPDLWNQLDKYHFEQSSVVSVIQTFNTSYASVKHY